MRSLTVNPTVNICSPSTSTHSCFISVTTSDVQPWRVDIPRTLLLNGITFHGDWFIMLLIFITFDVTHFPVVHHELSLWKTAAPCPEPSELKMVPGGFVLRVRLSSYSSKIFVSTPGNGEARDHKVSDDSVNVNLRRQAYNVQSYHILPLLNINSAKNLNSLKNARDRSSYIQWRVYDVSTLFVVLYSIPHTPLTGKITSNVTEISVSSVSVITSDLAPGAKIGDHHKNRREISI